MYIYIYTQPSRPRLPHTYTSTKHTRKPNRAATHTLYTHARTYTHTPPNAPPHVISSHPSARSSAPVTPTIQSASLPSQGTPSTRFCALSSPTGMRGTGFRALARGRDDLRGCIHGSVCVCVYVSMRTTVRETRFEVSAYLACRDEEGCDGERGGWVGMCGLCGMRVICICRFVCGYAYGVVLG